MSAKDCVMKLAVVLLMSDVVNSCTIFIAGVYNVILDENHLENLLFAQTSPPISLVSCLVVFIKCISN